MFFLSFFLFLILEKSLTLVQSRARERSFCFGIEFYRPTVPTNSIARFIVERERKNNSNVNVSTRRGRRSMYFVTFFNRSRVR